MCDSDSVIVKGDKLEMFNKLVKESKNVAVLFKMSWCPACIKMEPFFKLYRQLCIDNEADKGDKKLKMLIVDGESAPEILDDNGVTSFPQVWFYKNGVNTKKIIGVGDREKAMIAKEFKSLGLHQSSSF